MGRETLACTFPGGPHKFTREATRGRKPERCPKHPKSGDKLITKAGIVLTPEVEAELVEEAEAGYEIVGWVDVDPEPVTLRSTKTSKEAPQSPQEPFTPRLVTRGKGRGGKATSGAPGGLELSPAELARLNFGRRSDHVIADLHERQERDRELAEKVATGEIPSQDLYCENGDHEWTRFTTRGRKPLNCKQHPNVIDLDANAEEKRRKAEELVDRLEAALMRNGTHISQHPPAA